MITKHETKPSKLIDIIQSLLLILLLLLIFVPDHSQSSNLLDRNQEEISRENIQKLLDKAEQQIGTVVNLISKQ